MNKIDELILASGTTGNHQVWFTRPELMKLKDLIIKECIDVCLAAKHNDCLTGHEFTHVADQITERFSK